MTRVSPRLAPMIVLTALTAAIILCGLYLVDANQGATTLQAFLVPDDPDLKYVGYFGTVGMAAALILSGALVLSALFTRAILRPRVQGRLIYGLSVLWSILALLGVGLNVGAMADSLMMWPSVTVPVPLETLNPLLVLACLLCFGGSVYGWWKTPGAPHPVVVRIFHAPFFPPQNHES
jgi:hypothetical protein